MFPNVQRVYPEKVIHRFQQPGDRAPLVAIFFRWSLATLPETNTANAPENGWLEYEDVSF